jgi:hypothetical protein
VPDVVLDCLYEIANAAEGASPNLFPSDFSKPAFYLIEPRRTGGGEVNVVAWPFGQPFLHLRMLVGSVVVEYEVNIERAID